MPAAGISRPQRSKSMLTLTLDILDTSPSKWGSRRAGPQARRVFVYVLHGEVLPLLRLGDGQADDVARDFDHMRWFLMHEKASVFVEDGDWYLLVHTPCKHLQPNNLCGIYETRPKICRDYTTDKCEYDEDWVYDHYWETAEQVVEYAEAVLGPRRGESFRSPKLETLDLANFFLPKWQVCASFTVDGRSAMRVFSLAADGPERKILYS